MPNRGHVFDLDGEGMVDDLAGSGLVAGWAKGGYKMILVI